jgi:hypothetical protein
VRTLAALLPVVFLGFAAAACGSAKATSVAAVERAFARHGVPFQVKTVPDPNLRPQPDYWPPLPAREEHRLQGHLLAVLGAFDSKTLTGEQVFVFDSSSWARLLQRLVPGYADRKRSRSVRKGSTTESGFVVRHGNLIVIGGFDWWPRVRAALADLR